MNNNELITNLLAPLSRNFGVLIALIGVYSLYINTAEAKRQNHVRDAAIAHIGGWCYIAIGIAVIIYSKFS